MSRRTFKPTAEQRGWVEAMSGYGMPQAEICLLIKQDCRRAWKAVMQTAGGALLIQ
jgi:hypothetical protein